MIIRVLVVTQGDRTKEAEAAGADFVGIEYIQKIKDGWLDCDVIVARTYHHSDTMELGRYASVPVINGLSDLYHPCQTLADLFTVREKFKIFTENYRLLTITN